MRELKTLIIILTIAAMLACWKAHGIGQDKVQHVYTSAFLATFGYGLGYVFLDGKKSTPLERVLFGAAFALSLGAVKELADMGPRGSFDWADIGANAIGVGVVSIPLSFIP